MMKCRKRVSPLGSAATSLPITARTQQPALPVIGFLGTRSREHDTGLVTVLGHSSDFPARIDPALIPWNEPTDNRWEGTARTGRRAWPVSSEKFKT
ncbi:MAG: hypothetical protein QOI12_2523 [Alphaproteobacteria bacterium]|jgi:hypothetical protein|nr:hypothetical protein [Alphaproteobacteria bacterium]